MQLVVVLQLERVALVDRVPSAIYNPPLEQ
jgi:hypothetical protein